MIHSIHTINQRYISSSSIEFESPQLQPQTSQNNDDLQILESLKDISLKKRSSTLCKSVLQNCSCDKKEGECNLIHKEDPSYKFGLIYHKINKKSAQKKVLKNQISTTPLKRSMRKQTSICIRKTTSESQDFQDDQTTVEEISEEEQSNCGQTPSDALEDMELLFESEVNIPLEQKSEKDIQTQITQQQLSCEICSCDYDLETVPVSMKCGHTICYTCLLQVKSEKSLNKYYMQNQQRQSAQQIEQFGRPQPPSFAPGGIPFHVRFPNIPIQQLPQRPINPVFNQPVSVDLPHNNTNNINLKNYNNQGSQELFEKVLKFHQHEIDDSEFNDIQEQISEKIQNSGEKFFKEEIEKYDEIQCPFCRQNINKNDQSDLEVNQALLLLSIQQTKQQ